MAIIGRSMREGYSETKYRLRISLAHPRDCPFAMCSDFLYQLRSHRHHFVKFVLWLCLFLCVKHVWDNWRSRRLWNRSLIRFLKARNVLPSEIHHQTFQVYGDNAMSDGMVRKWVRLFNEGWENVHDEARSGCPSLVQADVFNKEDHVHRTLGQTRCPLGRIFAPRHNNKLCSLLWNAEEAEACDSKQKARNAECHHSFASR